MAAHAARHPAFSPIIHGVSALRPGMAMPAVVGRLLDRPVVNLGLCGSARAEPEMAELLAKRDPAAYVVDVIPNLTPELVWGPPSAAHRDPAEGPGLRPRFCLGWGQRMTCSAGIPRFPAGPTSVYTTGAS
jgi:hypothetical protein